MLSHELKLGHCTSIHSLGDEAVLFRERTGHLVLLRPTAAAIYRGIEAGLSVDEMAVAIARASGTPPQVIAADVRNLVEQVERLMSVDCLSELTDKAVVHPRRILSLVPARLPESVELQSQLLDFPFTLRTSEPEITRLVSELVGHLASPTGSAANTVLEIVSVGRQWLLVRDGGEVVGECDALDGIAPMLHAFLVIEAYRKSECIAAVHGAVVTRGNNCILMPGVSGSGKSTLTAALLAHGFGYCTDDLALLSQRPIRARAAPMCLALKHGSWGVLADLLPEVKGLPIHVRSDHKKVRYLSPEFAGPVARASDSYEVCAIVFPSFAPPSSLQFSPMSSGEGLKRLTEAGYDLPGQLNHRSLALMIEWISDTPCFELRYGLLDDAVTSISKRFLE